MSSFYGQMRWQDFQRFFYNFTLNNQQFSSTNAFNKGSQIGFGETVDSETRVWLQPNEDFATLRVNAANHWIQLCPMDSIGDTQESFTGFSIFHNEPATSDLDTVKLFEVTTLPNDQNATILKSGDIFKVVEMKFDKAGHFSKNESLSPTYFQLPPQIIRVNWNKDLNLNEDQKFYFVNDDGLIDLIVNDAGVVLNIEHKSYFTDFDELDISSFAYEGPKDGTDYEVINRLAGGDYISTYEIEYDKAGHVTSLEKVYYQLPISEADERLDVLEDTVEALNADFESHLNDWSSYKDTIESSVNKITNLENFTGIDTNGTNTAMQTALNALKLAPSGTNYTVANGFEVIVQYLKGSGGSGGDPGGSSGDDPNSLPTILKGYSRRLDYIEGFLAGKYSEFKPPLSI